MRTSIMLAYRRQRARASMYRANIAGGGEPEFLRFQCAMKQYVCNQDDEDILCANAGVYAARGIARQDTSEREAGLPCQGGVYVKNRMLTPIAMQATETHGERRSPIRAHFQNVPRKLHDTSREEPGASNTQHVSARVEFSAVSQSSVASADPPVARRVTPSCVRRASWARMCVCRCTGRSSAAPPSAATGS